MGRPEPFEVYQAGVLLHGTKADLRVGDLIVPGHAANFGTDGRRANHVYVTETLDAAVWAAELARGEGAGRIYIVEPQGPVEDDPNVTDKRFPGNPTRSYRTREPVRVAGEVRDWEGHSPHEIATMRRGLAELQARGEDIIDD